MYKKRKGKGCGKMQKNVENEENVEKWGKVLNLDSSANNLYFI